MTQPVELSHEMAQYPAFRAPCKFWLVIHLHASGELVKFELKLKGGEAMSIG